MTEKQKERKILTLMDLASELRPEIETKEIKDVLANVNALFRKA
jgi:hypothetical protein